MGDTSNVNAFHPALSVKKLVADIQTRPTAVLETDAAGVICWCNAAWERASGWSTTVLAGQTLSSLLAQRCEDSPEREALLAALATGQASRARLQLRHRDAGHYWAEVELEPRDTRGWLLIERDISERLIHERRLQAVVQAGTDGIIEFAADGAVVACNDAAQAILGLSAADLIGRKPTDPSWQAIREDGSRFPGEDHAASLTLRSGEAVDDCIVGIPAAHGRIRWISSSSRPLHDAAGALVGAIAVVRDVTRQREAANRLSTLIRGAGVATWEVDLATGRVNRDAAWGELLGLSAEDIPDSIDGWQRLVHPEDYPRVAAARDGHLTGTSPEYRCEYRLRRADGQWAWILDAGQVIERDFAGQARRIAGVHIDISELREAHAQVTRASRRLAEQRSELQAIIDAIPALVFYKDDGNRILDLNRTAAQALGLPVEDVRGHRVEELFPPEDAGKYLTDDREVLRTGRPRFGILERYRDANGTYRSLCTDKIPLRGPDGHCDRLVSVAVDVSEQLEREGRIEQALTEARAASVAKSRFLESLGHEIRTALTAILGYADMLGDAAAVPVGDARADTAAVLRRAGERLLATINDILDLSQLEAGTLTLESRDISLVDLVREIELTMRPRLAETGAHLRLELRHAIPERILSDPLRLRQILVKLVDYAVRTGLGGEVVMAISRELSPEGERLVISLRDSGPGLDPAATEVLFESTPNDSDAIAPRHDGTQLGLMTARRLARLLGGQLDVQPPAPGDPAGFMLNVPLVASAGASLVTTLPESRAIMQSRIASERALEGLEVLVVEDGEDNRRLICHYLDSAGAKVTDVADGAAALTHLRRRHQQGRPPALVVSDIDMPVMDGYELAREAARLAIAPPMLALTAHALPEDRARCEAAGFDAYLVKPIDRQALLETCLALVGSDHDVNAITARRPDNGDHHPMLSEFAHDPDMQPLLAEFVGELPERISHLNVLATAGEYTELGRLAHQLKGAGGGYGYPAITEAAARLEQAARDPAVEAATVADALAELADSCNAAAVALDIPDALRVGGGMP